MNAAWADVGAPRSRIFQAVETMQPRHSDVFQTLPERLIELNFPGLHLVDVSARLFLDAFALLRGVLFDRFALRLKVLDDRKLLVLCRLHSAQVFQLLLLADIEGAKFGGLACFQGGDVEAGEFLNYLFLKESFGNAFSAAARKAGVKKSAHGVRKIAATTCADNGATIHQLMAIFGWTTTEMPELYTREANRKRLAREAVHTLTRTSAEHSIPAPKRVVRGSAKKT